MSIEKVFEYVVATGRDYILPGAWRGLECDRTFFRPKVNSAALLEQLQGKFAVGDLINSGVVRRDDDGSVVLHPALSSPDSVLWALYAKPKSPPFQIVADLQYVRKMPAPFAAPFQDFRTATLIKHRDDRVAVAFSMSDLAILRSLEIPSIPACGLYRLDRPDLERFCRVLKIVRDDVIDFPTGKPVPDTTGGRSLVLIDWSVERMEACVQTHAEELWSYWTDLKRHLKLAIADFLRLQPTTAELAAQRCLVEHGWWDQVREEILDGHHVNARSLHIEKSPPRPLHATLSDARSNYRRKLSSPDPLNPRGAAAARLQAWADVQTHYEQQLLEPLIQLACDTHDPLERNLLLMMADVCRLLHPQMAQLSERVSRVYGEHGVGGAISQEEFQQLIAVMDRMMALHQGIQTCRKNQLFSKNRRRRLNMLGGTAGESTSHPKSSPQSASKDS